jgi:hypothetical protein
VLAREVRADGGIAHRLQKREEVLLFEIEMTLDFRLHGARDLAQQQRVRVVATRGSATALSRDESAETIENRKSGSMLIVKRPDDAVGAHPACTFAADPGPHTG